MGLTKEECEGALKGIDSHLDNEYDEHDNKLTAYFSWHLIILENLINEHFDNPPLKFEELKVIVPYWDNEEKSWCYFVSLNYGIETGVKVTIGKTPMMSAFRFKEGRFFAGEVKA